MEENLFKLYRKRAGYSQIEAANALHVTASAVSSWESGRYTPDPQNLAALADLYGVTIDHLMGRTSPLEPFGKQITETPKLIPETEVQIPLVASLRCGPGESGDPFTIIKPINVPASYIRKWGEDIKAIVAIGESMSPTIIPGDTLICKPGEAWTDGNVVSVNVDDNDMIKRIYHTRDGGVDLRSDNKDFDTLHFTPDELENGRVHVLGRVMIPIGKEL